MFAHVCLSFACGFCIFPWPRLDSHRMKLWGQIAEDHKALGNFSAQLQTLADCGGLGADVTELTEEIQRDAQR